MIGEALRLIRVFNDKKLIEVAKHANISSSYLSEIEQNKKSPSLDVIEKLANYYNCKPSSILFFSEKLNDDSIKSKIHSSVQNKIIYFLQIIEKGKNAE